MWLGITIRNKPIGNNDDTELLYRLVNCLRQERQPPSRPFCAMLTELCTLYESLLYNRM